MLGLVALAAVGQGLHVPRGRGRVKPFRVPRAALLPEAEAFHRHFVVACHNVTAAVSRGRFSANNLLEGRVDVLARCATSALWVSNGVRRDTTLWLCLGRDTVEVRGADVVGLNPDEKTTALFLQRALSEDDEDEDEDETAAVDFSSFSGKSQRNLDKVKRKAKSKRAAKKLPPPPGFTVRRGETLDARLAVLSRSRPYFVLHETGADVDRGEGGVAAAEDDGVVLVVSDQLGWTAAEEATFAADARASLVSFGPMSLLTSQCITLAHNRLDRGLWFPSAGGDCSGGV